MVSYITYCSILNRFKVETVEVQIALVLHGGTAAMSLCQRGCTVRAGLQYGNAPSGHFLRVWRRRNPSANLVVRCASDAYDAGISSPAPIGCLHTCPRVWWCRVGAGVCAGEWNPPQYAPACGIHRCAELFGALWAVVYVPTHEIKSCTPTRCVSCHMWQCPW